MTPSTPTGAFDMVDKSVTNGPYRAETALLPRFRPSAWAHRIGPSGRKVVHSVARWGYILSLLDNQGLTRLTPLAIDFRPVGAWIRTRPCCELCFPADS